MGMEMNVKSKGKFCITYFFFYVGEIEATFILCIITYIVWKENLIKWEGENRTETVLRMTLGICAIYT